MTEKEFQEKSIGSEEEKEKEKGKEKEKEDEQIKKKIKKTKWNKYDKKKNVPTKIKPIDFQKSNICKKYLTQTQLERFHYLHQRKKRLKLVKSELKKQKIEEESSLEITKHVHFNETTYLRIKRSKIQVEFFIILGLIGKGNYGSVFLIKEKKKNKLMNNLKIKSNKKEDNAANLYALKRVEKSNINSVNQIQNIWTEREILATHNSDWLVRLYSCFQDDEYLNFVMDYHPGGDLKSLLSEIGSVNEETAKFYLAEMICALEDLHSLGFIHRDLKPANFLIGVDGHLKLTDFGLSKSYFSENQSWKKTLKRVNDEKLFTRRYSIVGTPNYMSPEILSRKGYDNSVDFWSLGCILFEMLSGKPPFQASTIEETLSNILHYQVQLTQPLLQNGEKIIGEEAWDLIIKLLAIPIKEKPSVFIEKIKKHSFFNEIDFTGLKNSTPPFIPQLENEMDLSYFSNSYFKNFDKQVKTVIKNIKSPKNFSKKDVVNNFVGFTFTRID
ncbi:cell cycle protein kinase dbf2-related [Anaeramoeba flamelloides]|uniref:non-specific serine/threonine protein kinase n=1 Tax=Anaeramoeba flamelloides TaxID=1746091 RepID=A0AAV7ZVU9_9EUKA|nr:cell cycle protein kinase dbf2-related [Anaeramoeba flamelloides]